MNGAMIATSTKEKALVRWLNMQVAHRLLSKSELKGKLGQEVEAARKKAMAGLNEADLGPIKLTSTILETLALKLIRCKDVATLEQAVSYAESLLVGEVLIVQDDDTLKQNL
ncbi:hypothetical protein [Siphonobacter sp. SORGH_AS_0500]|uniref:hypothetical protein n=1 Tax=Siphonobacter sp. SORGH_AS_0500 TaxID=1864824 RepID=UPI002860251B|nr:hypothetical protein [Siphonobacter sp. SORGH_AS_0500]MDR6195942.1 hypothetical protein [Siphonobacter sp. SORGH_AS_0500]